MVGTTVGPYHVLARLGAGGMGEVFLGHDPRLERRIALKCLSRSESESRDARVRILREARAAARLNHPNIAGIYDVLEEGDRTYIVMEYVEGESLAIRLGRGRLPIDDVRTIGRQLASALAAAHAQGVVHRDLKPANVQLTRDGSIKVLDFGVAKLSPAIGASTDADTGAVDLTLPGNPGTPIYMSPEQLFNRDVDARSDIYSAGVILFEAATGRRPYVETGAVALALAMSTTAAPTAASVNPDVPADLDAAIARALERDPTQRFSSAAALYDALSPTGASTVSVPRSVAARPWPRRTLAAVALGTVLAAALAVGWPSIAVRWRGSSRVASPRPLVVAVLPVENPSRDTEAEYLGAGFASLIARNFGSVPHVTVLARDLTAPFRQTPDLGRLQRELGADYVIDLTVTSPPPRAEVQSRLIRVKTGAVEWAETLAGDPLSVEQALLGRLIGAFDRAGAWPVGLTGSDRQRLSRGPTTSARAFAEYSEARALLDRRGDPANVARAVELLESALQIDPGFQLASASLGDAYLEQYRVQRDPSLAAKANEAVARALRASSGDDPWIYYALGNVQWSTGRYEDALASLRKSLALQPDNDETHTLLARVLADRGEIEEAIASLQTAIRIRPDFWRTYMVLGGIAYRAGRFSEALDAYRRAAELRPDDPGPFSGLGLVHQVRGELSEALGNYEHAVQLGPSATAYSNLGVVYYTAGRFTDAVQAWQRALSIEPKNALYHRNIGDAYRRLKQPRLAEAAYTQAIAAAESTLALNPRDIDAISTIAVCEAKLGNRSAAERRAAEALALAPENRIALQRSAEVHAILGNADIALRDLRRAIDRGYSRATASGNDEFESLRKLPEFQRLTTGASPARQD